MSNETGKYLYCILEGTELEPINLSGIGSDSQIYTISYKDLLAVVSDTEKFIFDPTHENALAHEEVISEVMKSTTVVPMSFGNVFNSEEDIKVLLESVYDEIKDVLKKVAGKIELGVKAFWDYDEIMKEIKAENQELANLEQADYQFQMRIGQEVAQLVDEKKAYYITEIIEPLNELAIASKENRTVGDRMILNAAFLIERDVEEEFDVKVNEIYERFKDELKFKYTGPWPPYNFINIKLEVKDS